MIYALIRNNLVENIIEAEPDFAKKISVKFDFVIQIDKLEKVPGIGWGYDGKDFITPEVKEDGPPIEEPPPETDPELIAQISELTTRIDDLTISVEKLTARIEALGG